jgi:hypothetical protein
MCRSSYTLGLIVAAVTSATLGAESHHLLVLDVGMHRGADRQQLLLLDVETGSVLARADLGTATNLAVTDDAGTVAALTTVADDKAKPEGRLNFYRTSDLSLVQQGRFPNTIRQGFNREGYAASISFSPDGKEIIVGSLEGAGNVDFGTTVVTRVKRESDDEGFYRAATAVEIKPCRSVDFVRLSAWPKVTVLNHTFTLLQTIDLDTGKILAGLPVGDPPAPTDPKELQAANRATIFQMRIRGILARGGERYTYYIPYAIRSRPKANEPLPAPGHLKKIDLSGDSPSVVIVGEPVTGLRANIASVSQRAGRIFVLEDRQNEEWTYEPSRWIDVFRTSDLSFERQVELPLADCHRLATSRDGKYLYASGPLHPPYDPLSANHAQLVVIDAQSGRLVKVLDAGRLPVPMFPAAEE